MSAGSSAVFSPMVSRRQSLLALGLGGISVAFFGACSSIPVIPKRPTPTQADALGWIELRADGRFELKSPRMEMGQHVLHAWRRVAALELGIDELSIGVMLPSTGAVARFKATVGSDSVAEVCEPLALACAALRQALLQRAAERMGVADGLVMSDAAVAAGAKRVALKDLARPRLELTAPDAASTPLRYRWSRADRFASQPAADLLEVDVLRGRPLYAADVRLDGMLFAAVLHPNCSDQAAHATPLLSFDEAAVRSVPGFHSIVRHRGLSGPALVATRMGALVRMKQLAKPVWAKPADELRVSVESQAPPDPGPSHAAQRPGADAIELRLDVPMAAHAAMEPRCAVAHFDSPKTLRLWCGSQDPFYVRDVLARDTGLPLDAITVQPMRMGGAFGGRTIASVEREAALVAKVVNAAVKLQWFRDDEFTAGFHRPPSAHYVQARVVGGKLQSWQHALSTSHVLFTNAVLPPWLQGLAQLAGDKGSARGHLPPYSVAGGKPKLDVSLRRLSVLTGPWRGLGAGPNVMSMEVVMDRAARAADADPIAFRLAHLDAALPMQRRLAQTLSALRVLMRKTPSVAVVSASVATKSEVIGLRSASAVGVACGIYKEASYAAAAAWVTVEVDTANMVRGIRVQRLACTHDCGWVLDADGVRAQVQGNLVWCLGMVLHEALEVDAVGIGPRNFDAYTVPRMSHVPPMDIELIASNEAPGGAGETAIVAGGGAIANAVLRALDALGYAPMHLKLPLQAGWKLNAQMSAT